MEHFLDVAECRIKENILKAIYPLTPEADPNTPVLHNLTTPTFHKYVVREKLENDILAALNSYSSIFISSFGGNGKSSCAYYIARKCVDKAIGSNIDTVIWVCDKGNPGGTTLDTIYTALLKTLGVDILYRFSLLLVLIHQSQPYVYECLLAWLQFHPGSVLQIHCYFPVHRICPIM
jgi:hypothetical protein